MDVSGKAEGLVETWRRLNFEQRAAAVGALLLIVSTFGPFSFVEAGLVVMAAGVLYLLKQRADGRVFHLPFGDGTVILVAGVWAALLILVRLFDRPLGQGLLALVCAAILVLAGIRERAKRPPDDLPPETVPGPSLAPRREPGTRRRRQARAAAGTPGGEDLTQRLEDVPEPDAPPEFDPDGETEVTPAAPDEEPTRKLDREPPDQLELLDDSDPPEPV